MNNFSKIWVIGDIHGQYDMLNMLVNQINADENDTQLVFLGDYVDRGKQSKQVLDYLLKLPPHHVLLSGNHEQMMFESFVNPSEQRRRNMRDLWLYNGGRTVLDSFGVNSVEELEPVFQQKYIKLIDRLLLHYKIPSLKSPDGKAFFNFICVHAGFSTKVPFEELLTYQLYNGLNRWAAKYSEEESPVWVREHFLDTLSPHWGNNIIIHGHTPVQLLEGYVMNIKRTPENFVNALHPNTYAPPLPFARAYPKQRTTTKHPNICSIDIDTGAAMNQRLTAICISPDNIDNNNRLHIPVTQVSATLQITETSITVELVEA